MTGHPPERNTALAKTISSMKLDNYNSWPDLLDLQANGEFYPLFVYGSEQRDQTAHFRLKRSKSIYQGRGVTADRGFIMTKDKRFCAPLVFNQPSAPTAAHIFGEVYLVEPETIFELDSWYERGPFARRYRRTISYVDPADSKKRRWLTSCFLYTHIFEAFKEKIKDGDYELMKTVSDYETGVPIFRWYGSDDKPNKDRLQKIQETTEKIKAETEATRKM